MALMKSVMGAAAALLMLGGVSHAQGAFPEKPIEILVGYNAGGPVDILARTFAPFLEKHLGDGASVVVRNEPGASGIIAATDVAQADPDGYSLLMFSHPALFTTLYGQSTQPYTMESFDYIGTLTSEPHNLFVAKNSKYQTLDELIEDARARPGEVTIGAAGIGAAGHLAIILFEEAAGIKFNYIPAPGAAESVTQVLGGHIEAGVTTISGTLPLYESGQVRLLGTFTAERWPELPDVPTFKEQGVDVEWGAVRGLAAPAGLPPELSETLSGAVKAAAEDPEFIAAADKAGIALSYLDGPTFRAMAEKQITGLQKVWETNPWQ